MREVHTCIKMDKRDSRIEFEKYLVGVDFIKSEKGYRFRFANINDCRSYMMGRHGHINDLEHYMDFEFLF